MEAAVLAVAAHFAGVDGAASSSWLLRADADSAQLEASARAAGARVAGGARDDFERQRAVFEASLAAQAEVVAELQRKLASSEDLAREERIRLQGQAERDALLQALRGPVAAYLANSGDPALGAVLQAALERAPALEQVRAFRMVREKVQQRQAQESAPSAAVTAPGVARNGATAAQLSALRDALESAPVEAIVVPRRELVEHVGAGHVAVARDLADAFRWLLAHRFAREPEVSLYAALHHNYLMELSAVCATLKLLDIAMAADCDAVRVLNSCLGALLHREVEEHLRDVVGPPSMPVAVKRCAHVIGVARKTWTGVLEPQLLDGLLGVACDRVAQGLVAHVLRSCEERDGGFSVTECAELDAALVKCIDGLRVVGGFAATSAAQRRLRLLQDMLALPSMADFDANVDVLRLAFSERELSVFVEAVYTDNAKRAALLLRLASVG